MISKRLILDAGIAGLLMAGLAAWIWASRALMLKKPAPDVEVRRVAGIAEHHVYAAILVLLAGAYAYASFWSSSHPFGFAKLRYLGLIGSVVAFLVLPGLAFRVDERLGSARVARWTARIAEKQWLIALAVLFILVALPLRNYWINADGRQWPELFRTKGLDVNLDQILELVVHYAFWNTIGQSLGWDVTFSYQVLSVIGGAAFLLILARLCPLLVGEKGMWLLLWLLSGGFMQLFFGDVENYSLVTPLMLLYVWLSIRYLQGRASLLAPSLVLAIAGAFHLLTVFLGPAWLYLAWLELRRRGTRDVLLSILIAVVVLAITFFIVHFGVLGFRIVTVEAMVETWARLTAWSGGLNPGIWLASRNLDYYFEITNLMMLLVPQALVLAPLLLYRRLDTSPTNVFLGISGVMFLVMLAIWFSGLGVPHDWNVFAPMSVMFSLWCGYNFVRIEGLRYKTALLVGFIVLPALHSYTWIVCNHFPTCP